MAGYGIVASMKDFYWDIRPKPEYGTIEIRICDTPLTVELAAQLAAYAQTLAADLLRNRRDDPIEPLYRVYGYNRFQACRFGFDGELVDPFGHRTRGLRDDLLGDARAPHARGGLARHRASADVDRGARRARAERQPLAARALPARPSRSPTWCACRRSAGVKGWSFRRRTRIATRSSFILSLRIRLARSPQTASSRSTRAPACAWATG